MTVFFKKTAGKNQNFIKNKRISHSFLIELFTTAKKWGILVQYG